MDALTIAAYNREAERISDLHQKLIPDRLYALISKYFLPGLRALDIGCGSGRDTAWLAENGFDVLGIDASVGMLDQAVRRYPGLDFKVMALPELEGIADASFSNVLCSAVFMHLDQGDSKIAALNILRVLLPGGILILSIRGTNEVGKRENGKLYEEMSREDILGLFDGLGAGLIFSEDTLEAARNHIWHTFVFKK